MSFRFLHHHVNVTKILLQLKVQFKISNTVPKSVQTIFNTASSGNEASTYHSLKLVTVKKFYFSRTEQGQTKKNLSFSFSATQCGMWILLPQAGPELRSPALGGTSPKPWTARGALQ